MQKNNGLKPEKIIEELKREKIILEAPRNRGYISVEVYERWCKVEGLVHEEYCKKLDNLLNSN